MGMPMGMIRAPTSLWALELSNHWDDLPQIKFFGTVLACGRAGVICPLPIEPCSQGWGPSNDLLVENYLYTLSKNPTMLSGEVHNTLNLKTSY